MLKVLNKNILQSAKCLKHLRFASSEFNHTNLDKPIHQSILKGIPNFPESQEEVEICEKEWEYVERLLPMKYIPVPNVEPGVVMPSGWRAPAAKTGDYPYFVNRNHSHLFRLSLYSVPVFEIKRTYLKGVEGDVFALGDELRQYLLEKSGLKVIGLTSHEAHGVIIIRGDFGKAIERWLLAKGF